MKSDPSDESDSAGESSDSAQSSDSVGESNSDNIPAGQKQPGQNNLLLTISLKDSVDDPDSVDDVTLKDKPTTPTPNQSSS